MNGGLHESLRHLLGLEAGEPLPLMLTVEEVAKALRISRGKAYDLAKRGELPGQVTRDRPIRVSTFQFLARLEGPGHPLNGSAEAALAGSWSFSPPEPDHLETTS